MIFTEKAKNLFWQDLSAGIMEAFKRPIGEAFHIDQFKTGHFSFTESVKGGNAAVMAITDKLKESSQAINSVRMTPMSFGYDSTYNVSIEFDPVVAESLYSDGKSSLATLEKDGKKYVVHDDGSATEVTDPDKYVDNLNKSTGSRYKKTEGTLDADGFPMDLDEAISLANEALEDTGVTVSREDGNLVMRGDSAYLKPAQQYLPAPQYGMVTLEGGYSDETGDLTLGIPDDLSEVELEQLRSFLIGAVNSIIDDAAHTGDTCSDDEWCAAMAEAEPDDGMLAQYGYKGESFIGDDKKRVATLVKSLLHENRTDEALSFATKHMGREMAEGFTRKYASEKVEETRKVIYTDEMTILDRMHESAVAASPGRGTDMRALMEKNLSKKEG